MKRVAVALCLLLCSCIALIIQFNKLAVSPELAVASAITKKVSSTMPKDINEIPLPEGYKRIEIPRGSLGEWLRQIKLRKDDTVYLFNGTPKTDQTLHYAVLDISTGKKDLQQCADAIMRLKAEYFFSKKQYDSIDFSSAHKRYNFQQKLDNADVTGKDVHVLLLQFMETVFMNCGTYTVDDMTKMIDIHNILPGDVFVKAGAPGHAMIVVDVAVNETTGKKIYLLAQGYMPAQDIHIVINPHSSTLSPWYEVNDDEKITTPGWVFTKDQLKRWK
jgi:hypothetical protein